MPQGSESIVSNNSLHKRALERYIIFLKLLLISFSSVQSSHSLSVCLRMRVRRLRHRLIGHGVPKSLHSTNMPKVCQRQISSAQRSSKSPSALHQSTSRIHHRCIPPAAESRLLGKTGLQQVFISSLYRPSRKIFSRHSPDHSNS